MVVKATVWAFIYVIEHTKIKGGGIKKYTHQMGRPEIDYEISRKYWNKLKQRLKEEGSQLVTNCHQLKMTAQDGKKRMTDVANTEQGLLLCPMRRICKINNCVLFIVVL